MRKLVGASGAVVNNTTFRRNIVRNFGISDKIMDFAHSKVADRKEETFRKTMDTMVQTKKWSLNHWRVTLEESLNSWLLKIPGMKDSNEVSSIKQYKEILDVMTPEELDNHEVIKGANRARIARASGKTEEDVSKCLFFYKNTLVVQKWLLLRKENNEKLPSSEGELAAMQEEDPRVQAIAKAVMYPEGKKKHGRGRNVRL